MLEREAGGLQEMVGVVRMRMGQGQGWRVQRWLDCLEEGM